MRRKVGLGWGHTFSLLQWGSHQHCKPTLWENTSTASLRRQPKLEFNDHRVAHSLLFPPTEPSPTRNHLYHLHNVYHPSLNSPFTHNHPLSLIQPLMIAPLLTYFSLHWDRIVSRRGPPCPRSLCACYCSLRLALFTHQAQSGLGGPGVRVAL